MNARSADGNHPVAPASADGDEAQLGDPPEIDLSYGAAVWVLSEMGFRGEVSKKTFNEYLKSLRKLGLPFPRGAAGGHWSRYSYDHLMELAVALTLRVYNTLPDAIVAEIVGQRPALIEAYREAYRHRSQGAGSLLRIRRRNCAIRLRGVFLDLQIDYRGGQLARFGPPRILPACEALETFAHNGDAARVFLPIKISSLAERIVVLAQRAPKAAFAGERSPKSRPDSMRREPSS